MMDPREFRNTLGHFATGVTIITTAKGEELVGLTANAFSSVSLEPPIILVCIDKKSSTMQAFEKDVPFAVNILQKDQEDACWQFAKRGIDKFEGASYTLSDEGVPILTGNLATIECTVAEVIEAGDHYIVTGNVKNAFYDTEVEPLLFFRGKIEHVAQKELTEQ